MIDHYFLFLFCTEWSRVETIGRSAVANCCRLDLLGFFLKPSFFLLALEMNPTNESETNDSVTEEKPSILNEAAVAEDQSTEDPLDDTPSTAPGSCFVFFQFYPPRFVKI